MKIQTTTNDLLKANNSFQKYVYNYFFQPSKGKLKYEVSVYFENPSMEYAEYTCSHEGTYTGCIKDEIATNKENLLLLFKDLLLTVGEPLRFIVLEEGVAIESDLSLKIKTSYKAGNDFYVFEWCLNIKYKDIPNKFKELSDFTEKDNNGFKDIIEKRYYEDNEVFS